MTEQTPGARLPPHLRRAREPRARSSRRSSPPRPTWTCSSSTTTRPTAPGGSPTRSPRASRASTCSTAPGKQGLGRAYLAGFDWALARGYAYVLEMDADFSHDPRYLPVLLGRARTDADLVLGSRYVKGGGTVELGARRKLISRGGSLYARTILGVARPRPHRRVQVLPARGARGDRPPHGGVHGLRLPDRADLPRAAARLPRRRDADRVRRPAGRASRRCRGGSCSRRCARCGRSAAPGSPAALPERSSPAPRGSRGIFAPPHGRAPQPRPRVVLGDLLRRRSVLGGAVLPRDDAGATPRRSGARRRCAPPSPPASCSRRSRSPAPGCSSSSASASARSRSRAAWCCSCSRST